MGFFVKFCRFTYWSWVPVRLNLYVYRTLVSGTGKATIARRVLLQCRISYTYAGAYARTLLYTI